MNYDQANTVPPEGTSPLARRVPSLKSLSAHAAGTRCQTPGVCLPVLRGEGADKLRLAFPRFPVFQGSWFQFPPSEAVRHYLEGDVKEVCLPAARTLAGSRRGSGCELGLAVQRLASRVSWHVGGAGGRCLPDPGTGVWALCSWFARLRVQGFDSLPSGLRPVSRRQVGGQVLWGLSNGPA